MIELEEEIGKVYLIIQSLNNSIILPVGAVGSNLPTGPARGTVITTRRNCFFTQTAYDNGPANYA